MFFVFFNKRRKAISEFGARAFSRHRNNQARRLVPLHETLKATARSTNYESIALWRPWVQPSKRSTVCYRSYYIVIIHMPGYLDGNVPHGVCLFTPNEIQQDYLADVEARWGEPLAPSAGGELPITGVYSWGAPPLLGSATHRI